MDRSDVVVGFLRRVLSTHQGLSGSLTVLKLECCKSLWIKAFAKCVIVNISPDLASN